MADLLECRAGDLGSWAIGRTITGIDRFKEPYTVQVAEVAHRPSAYEDEFVTIIRSTLPLNGITSHVVFPHTATITIHPLHPDTPNGDTP